MFYRPISNLKQIFRTITRREVWEEIRRKNEISAEDVIWGYIATKRMVSQGSLIEVPVVARGKVVQKTLPMNKYFEHYDEV